MKKSLNGAWQLIQCGKSNIMSAKVPGCNFLDLIENKVIDDPFVGTNESNAQWVLDEDWQYTRSFEITEEELQSSIINLDCKMLDTICDVYINGLLVGRAKNCHRAYSFPVKEKLVVGENIIKIVFHSAKKYVEHLYREVPTPINSNGQNGIVHIRKPQYHFGWDWGPILTPCGISDDIELTFIDTDFIKNISVTQIHTESKVTVEAKVEAFQLDGKCDYEIILISPNGEEKKTRGNFASFEIENPELWWTYELSGKKSQPLYIVKALALKNGEIVDSQEKKIGLRTIELNREKDEYGSNFQFVLNGVPLFIKGSNYIPSDSFMNRFDSEKLETLLDAVQFSNMNMLRIWGGGFYGSDELYDECDRRGILLWQDFAFACQAYPFFLKDFLDNVIDEVEYNVKRIAHHPSLAVWCGNNEIEDMHMSWVHMKKYVDWTEKFFYHILPDEIRKYDALTPYTPGSPIGTAHNENVGSDRVGDTHLWGVWHGLQPMNYYRKRMTRFCSEFGFESLPDMKTIKTFAKPEEYPLSSDVMKAHQKCINGNDKMIYYIASRFDLPNNIEDTVYLSQITQQECIADATEHWRRNKGRCNGSMYWQLNDCWQVCSWSSLDYFFNYKALQYKAKWFNAPVSVSIEDTENHISIYVLNDLNKEVNVTAEYEIFDFVNGSIKTEKKDITVSAVKNELAFDFDICDVDKLNCAVSARLYMGGERVMQKITVLAPEKKLNLPKTKIDMKAEIKGDELVITLKADSFARLLMLDNCSSNPFSDNYFDLLPNESRVITQRFDSNEQLETLTVKSICDVNSNHSKLADGLKRLKVFFSPINISNAVYHGRVPKE